MLLKLVVQLMTGEDSFKSTMHTSGFYFTGQVNIESQVDSQMKNIITGEVSGITDGQSLVQLIHYLQLYLVED